MAPSDPKYERKLEDLERRVLEQPGALDQAVRRAVAEGGEPHESLVAYVEKVRRHAYKVTDAEVADLLVGGFSEDQVFELTVAAAYGAARRRLDAGLLAMAATRDMEAATHAEVER